MEWQERREGNFLVSRTGKIMGLVSQGIGSSIYRAEVVYAGGGTHRNSLGDYINEPCAREAVEKSVRELGLEQLPVEQA